MVATVPSVVGRTPADPTLDAPLAGDVSAGRSWARRRIDRFVALHRWIPVPVTIVYIMALLALGTLLSAQSNRDQTRILFHLSTNLHNLLHGHFSTLISSAFVTDGPAWTLVPLLGCVLVLAELRFGSRRMVETFMAGHIGATLLVAVGLFIGVRAHWFARSVGWAQDVGVSYGTMALIGAFAVMLPPRWRLPWAYVWLAFGVLGIVLGRTFTNVGHFTALVIGLLLAMFMARTGWVGRRGAKAMSRLELGLLLASVVVGGLFLLG
jgi:hypothetical protein